MSGCTDKLLAEVPTSVLTTKCALLALLNPNLGLNKSFSVLTIRLTEELGKLEF